MLEFKTRVLQFNFNNEKHEIKFPTVKEIQDYNESLEKEKNEMKAICDLIVGLGLERSVCEQLEVPHLEAILKELTSTKK